MELNCKQLKILCKCIEVYTKKYKTIGAGILPQLVKDIDMEKFANTHSMPNYRNDVYNLFFFSHKLCRALWGEKDWKYHLQQMVICDDPFLYLEKHLRVL